MKTIIYILLAIFVPYIMTIALGLIIKLSQTAWKSFNKIKNKKLGKFLAITVTSILVVAALAYAVLLILLELSYK